MVAFGGGNGLPVVLRGLRRHLPSSCRITAVVTTADNGGSSGVLRTQYGVLPPGDIRNCLLALARVAPEVLAALQYRFDGDGYHHPVGNLLLTALDMVAADESTAIRLAAQLLRVDDRVLPATAQPVHLVADLIDGRSVHGEADIPRSGVAIKRLRLDPADVAAGSGVLDAIHEADTIVLSPGSLYTSLLATLIVPGVADALRCSRGVRIFVCNAMTEPGETDGYGVAEHLRALAAHGVPVDALDYGVVSTSRTDDRVLARYAAEGATPVAHDGTPLSCVVVHADVLEAGPVVRHAPDKLGPLLCDLASGRFAGERTGRIAAEHALV